MTGKTKNYKFGNKNNWRRTVWNIAAKHIPKKKNAICLYVGDEKDLDRPVAIKKGFYSNNLILVNNDKKVVDKIRRQKKLAITGDVQDILSSWNSETKISFANLDVCCGIEKSIFIDVFNCLFLPVVARPGVVCFNLQRGRDNYSNDIRNKYIKAIKKTRLNIKQFGIDSYKHRGFLLYSSILEFLMSPHKGKDISIEDFEFQAAFIKTLLEPVFLSYKSGVVMDSVIIKINKEMPILFQRDFFPERTKTVSPQISAVLAVRTMKRKRYLSPSPAY